MRGIIILEGADCTGKSTLASYFKERYNAVIIHATNRWLNKMWHYHNAILIRAIDLAFNKNRLVILDRHWPSEQVYASVFRNGGPTPRAGRLFDRVLRRFGAVYVNCLPRDREEHLELYLKNVDPGHDYKINAFKRVVQAYHDLWYGADFTLAEETFGPLTPLHEKSYGYTLAMTGGQFSGRSDCFSYDLFRDNVEIITSMVCDSLWRNEWSLAWMKDPSIRNYSGVAQQAKVVMVGDTLNRNKFIHDRHEPWPFHDYSDSSLHMLEALDAAHIREEQLCWTNSHHWKRNEDVILPCLVETYPLRIVALGAATDINVKRHKVDVPVTVIYHPSYARRFNVVEYPELVRRAIHGESTFGKVVERSVEGPSLPFIGPH